MKVLPLFISFMFFLAFAFGAILFSVDAASLNASDNLKEQFLEDLALSKGHYLNQVLEEAGKDVFIVSNSELVKTILMEGNLDGVFFAKEEIKNMAKDTAIDIQKYLEDNPSLTKEDLRNDDVFRDIALRRFGNEGYTVLYDGYSPMKVFLHFDKRWEGYHPELKETNLYPLVEDIENEDVYGFFTLKGFDGIFREKYLYGTKINSSLKFSIVSTNYLSDMVQSIRLNKYISEITNKTNIVKGYDGFYFIGNDGKIIWSTNSGEVDKKIEDISYFEFIENNIDTLLVENHINFFFEGGDIFAVSPSFSKDGLNALGLIVIKVPSTKLDYSEKGEGLFLKKSYLLNKESDISCPPNANFEIEQDLINCSSIEKVKDTLIECVEVPLLNSVLVVEMKKEKTDIFNFGILWIYLGVILFIVFLSGVIFDIYFKFRRVKK